MAEETVQHKRNEKIGLVVSNRMAKTIVVEVTRRVQHPFYRRVITKRKKFYAHDEQSTARVGDTVKIIESRPLSRLKRWTLGDILRRAVQVDQIREDADTAAARRKKNASRP